jgi:hypothetical protein
MSYAGEEMSGRANVRQGKVPGEMSGGMSIYPAILAVTKLDFFGKRQ